MKALVYLSCILIHLPVLNTPFIVIENYFVVTKLHEKNPPKWVLDDVFTLPKIPKF